MTNLFQQAASAITSLFRSENANKAVDPTVVAAFDVLTKHYKHAESAEAIIPAAKEFRDRHNTIAGLSEAIREFRTAAENIVNKNFGAVSSNVVSAFKEALGVDVANNSFTISDVLNKINDLPEQMLKATSGRSKQIEQLHYN